MGHRLHATHIENPNPNIDEKHSTGANVIINKVSNDTLQHIAKFSASCKLCAHEVTCMLTAQSGAPDRLLAECCSTRV